MTSDKGILIQNVYHMLAYAFQVLKQGNYEEVAAEEVPAEEAAVEVTIEVPAEEAAEEKEPIAEEADFEA